MQTEFRLRLLCADPDSPSGYRIVGHMHIDPPYCVSMNGGNIVIIEWVADDAYLEAKYDAFELGVKVGDTWYYEGDMVMDKDAMPPSLPMILRYEYSWLIEHSSGRRVRLHDVAEYITSTGRTIHDTGGTQ